MARTATASAGKAKGKGKTPKTLPPPSANPPNTKRKSKKPGKAPEAQTSFLATVKAENPNISSDEFALKFQVPIDEVVRMRHFLGEYLRDFCEKSAALRMGYPVESALSTGRLLLFHSYTQLKLLEMLDAMEAPKLVSASLIIARLWKEANNGDGLFNNAPNRIAALGKLAKIIGLENPKPKDPTPTGPIGGVMIVPMALHPDEWAKYSHASQTALKESTAIDV